MPFEYAINTDEMLILIKGIGNNPTFEEGMTTFGQVISDPTFQADFNWLVDVREVEYPPKFAEMQAYANEMKKGCDALSGKMAVVVTTNIHFGKVTITSTYFEPIGIKVKAFRDIELAKRWLNLQNTEQFHQAF